MADNLQVTLEEAATNYSSTFSQPPSAIPEGLEGALAVKTMWPLLWNAIYSLVAFFVTLKAIPSFMNIFMQAGFAGVDMGKKDRPKVAEAMGVISGCVFMITIFLFIPVPFAWHLARLGYNEDHSLTKEQIDFPHHEFVEFITAVLSVCCMLFLGFADDALNLRWRDKLFLPTIATIPLLMVYYVNSNSTTVIVPKQLRHLLGFSVNLGGLYYVFMGALTVFCTNAINILAGINGLEAGQSLIIAISVALFNLIELTGAYRESCVFSLYFLLPYIGTTAGLLRYNWFPSRVFVGDTFCYFSGVIFAVVAILGHFSKTLLLFFIPQIINFLYSIPQLFKFLPCPRHRLPRYDPDTDKLNMSTTKLKLNQLHPLGRLMFQFLRVLRLVHVVPSGDGEMLECNNLTLINLFLMILGPTHEKRLTCALLIFQVFSSLLAFFIRYQLAKLVYDV
ncbi:UDP-N-acetylglucosamine--dolichyl-phosphate N-acetylglucosaminephosphotransferase [Hypsibius exemplaris]|uniref:UDP-N-acetylglucosamine--dolichyl-phosphate N-acetylglucosaminephosphotransferase n=1 Tax=Hypsibius exemplaris TaxID=2072580 RepID=A0A1W0WF91_HYPEX|nr:UDP-N-acetylglucosamine--dolichyl-phosphate N-acetylglucosaminephosphotransferase [Hypsibius exemplaris]